MRSIIFLCGILIAALLLMHERLQQLPGVVADSYVDAQESPRQESQRSTQSAPAQQRPPAGGAELQNAAVERDATKPQKRYSRELELPRGPGGHYYLDAKVNGVSMTFLVDTGATDVALGAEHAKKLRLRLNDRDYTRRYETANGTVRGAPVELRQIQVGRLRLRDVEASVLDSELGMPLLGMSFLNRLDGYEVRGDTLVLRF